MSFNLPPNQTWKPCSFLKPHRSKEQQHRSLPLLKYCYRRRSIWVSHPGWCLPPFFWVLPFWLRLKFSFLVIASLLPSLTFVYVTAKEVLRFFHRSNNLYNSCYLFLPSWFRQECCTLPLSFWTGYKREPSKTLHGIDLGEWGRNVLNQITLPETKKHYYFFSVLSG